jgi:hypothetical protein
MAGGKTNNKPSSPQRADFDEIEAAVMETARGRWFLAEYARRHRAADTAAVLEVLARLETKLAATIDRAGVQPVAAAPAPAPEPVAAPPLPLPPSPAARADDLKAMAEELLRGSRLFDWVGPGDPETGEEQETDPWAPEVGEPAPLAPATDAASPEEQEPADEEPEEDPEIEDEDIAAWEAELTERRTPFPPVRDTLPPPPPRSTPTPQSAPPLVRSAEPPMARNTPPPSARGAPSHRSAPPSQPQPQVSALPEMLEIAPKPVERSRDLHPPAAPARPHPASFSASKPLPPGPRIDDPTLTMTRDEKLALFS